MVDFINGLLFYVQVKSLKSAVFGYAFVENKKVEDTVLRSYYSEVIKENRSYFLLILYFPGLVPMRCENVEVKCCNDEKPQANAISDIFMT